jgi:hypothetical protein
MTNSGDILDTMKSTESAQALKKKIPVSKG